VSQYLIKEVIYGGPGTYSAEDQILRIVLFRLFSRPQTWELLCAAHRDVTMDSFRAGGYGDTLEREFEKGGRLYTPAFILCATPAYGYKRKHRNHLALLNEMLRPKGLPQEVARARSLEALIAALRRYPLIGPFMAYQIAIDINYSELCDFDESEYTVAGPGAIRGVAKCFIDTSGRTAEEMITDLTAHQDEEFAKRGIDFRSLFGRPLQAIDVQNLFCELDKYARVAFPELRSNRSRIKAKFRPSGELPLPVFPPKWGLGARPQAACK
jgi:hypothetical protein